MATMAMSGCHSGDHRVVEVVGQVGGMEMFCSPPPPGQPGRLSTQLNTKNITVITIMTWAPSRMLLHFFSALAP